MRLFPADVALDVLDHDDRVVDDQADREDVARIVRRSKEKPKAAMKMQAPKSETGMATSGTMTVRSEPMNRKTTSHDPDRLGQRLADLRDGVAHVGRAVVRQAHVDVRGSDGRMLHGHELLLDLQLVGARQRPHREVDGRVVAEAGLARGLSRSQLDVGHVAQADDGALPLADDGAGGTPPRCAGPCR